MKHFPSIKQVIGVLIWINVAGSVTHLLFGSPVAALMHCIMAIGGALVADFLDSGGGPTPA